MEDKYEELIEACREGKLYDFISNEYHRFDKQELIEIIKNLDYAVYKRLGDQCKEVEHQLPNCLNEVDFFGKLTNEEETYIEYLSGTWSYETYLRVCKRNGRKPRAKK